MPKRQINELLVNRAPKRKLISISLNNFRMDPKNNRLFHLNLPENSTQDQIEEALFTLPDTKDLYEQIKRKGVQETPFAVVVPEETFGDPVVRVFDGNTRVAVCRRLVKEGHDRPELKSIPTYVYPETTTDEDINYILSQKHIRGVAKWTSPGQANHIRTLVNKGYTKKQIHEDTGLSIQYITDLLKSLDLFEQHQAEYPDLEPAESVKRFPWYIDLVRNKYTKQLLSGINPQYPNFRKTFDEWVGEGRINSIEDTRTLLRVIANDAAFSLFNRPNGTLDEANTYLEGLKRTPIRNVLRNAWHRYSTITDDELFEVIEEERMLLDLLESGADRRAQLIAEDPSRTFALAVKAKEHRERERNPFLSLVDGNDSPTENNSTDDDQSDAIIELLEKSGVLTAC